MIWRVSIDPEPNAHLIMSVSVAHAFFLSYISRCGVPTEYCNGDREIQDTGSFKIKLILEVMSGFIGSVYVIVNEAILGGWQCHLIQFWKQTLKEWSHLCSVIIKVSMFASSAVDCGFEPRSGNAKGYEIGIYCIPALHAALRSKSKSVDCCFSELALLKSNSACWYSTTQKSSPSHQKVTCSHHEIAENLSTCSHHEIAENLFTCSHHEIAENLFSPWYSWKLVLTMR